MGRASSSKKVARAARTGGGRTYTAQRPIGWYSAMAIVVILGLLVLVISVQDRKQQVAAEQTKVAPFEQGSEEKPAGDHWHTAYGVYACDEFLPFLEDNGRDPDGIHTHGDGVIHVHPFTRRAAGENAVLEVFEELMGMKFDADRIEYDGKTFKNGDDCDGKEGVVRFLVNGKEVKGDPSDYKYEDRDVIVVAFTPEGKKIPALPWADALDNLSDLGEDGTSEPVAPTTTVEGQEAPESSSTTTAENSTSTTSG